MEVYRKDSEYSYTLGMSISIELLENRPEIVQAVYYSSHIHKNEYYQKLLDLCHKYQIPLENDDKLIERLSVKENCYVIARFKKFPLKKTAGDHIVLVDFNDEGELGTILRTAISFGKRNIVLINSKLDLFKPKIVRASMGSIFYENIMTYPKLEDYLKDFPENNLYCLTKSGKNIHDIIFKKPYSLIFNAEKIADAIELTISHQDGQELPLTFALAITLHDVYQKNDLK